LTAYVLVQCKRRLADELVGSAATTARGRAIHQNIQAQHGTVLPSATPATGQSDESVFVTIEVSDFDRAGDLAATLRAMPGIEAAYPKPGEALP
jgi:hypothetical protein